MRARILAFLTGILLLQVFAILPAGHFFILWPLLLCLAWYSDWSGWRLLLAFLAGFSWAWWQADANLNTQLLAELAGEDVIITGQVKGIPKHRQHFTSFEFRPEILQFSAQVFLSPSLIRLNWYGDLPAQLEPGAKWQLRVRLKPPHGMMNPGSFDYEKWLFQRGVGATGYVRSSTDNQYLGPGRAWLNIDMLRSQIFQLLAQWGADTPHLPLIQALSVGVRHDMTEHQWQVLRDTGTAHLMAISGLHIGLMASLGFILGRWGWSSLPRLCLLWPAQKVGAVLAISLAFTYALLAGWSVPTQRAFIMVMIVMWGLVFYRQLGRSHILSLALLGVLIFDPLCVLASGFWLSFLAVSVLIFALQGNAQIENHWWQTVIRRWGYAQWAITLGLLPVSLLFFQQVSLVAPLANIWAIPVVGLFVVPLIFLSLLCGLIFPPLGVALLSLVEQILTASWWGLESMLDNPWSVWLAAAPPLWSIFLAMTGVALLLMPRGWPSRVLGLALMLPLMLVPAIRPEPGDALVSLLDVGQGLSMVIQTQNHVLLFDSGPRFGNADSGKRIIIPFLRQQGIRYIDTFIISHQDNDHSGGAQSIMQAMPVAQVLTSSMRHLDLDWANTHLCQAGQRWSWDNVEFAILHPDKNYLSHRRAHKTNNLSCVLKVSSGNRSLLVTADIEEQAEHHLINQYAQQLVSDVLVIPHHGSHTSSSVAFLEQVKPRFALLPVGYRNRYRLPNAQVMQRYHSRHIPVKSTASEGALQFRLRNEQNALITGYRQQVRRYWHYLAD